MKNRYIRAALLGALAFPVFEVGTNIIGSRHGSFILQYSWCIIAFFLPVFYAIIDFDYINKTGGFFRFRLSVEDWKDYHIPTIKRLFLFAVCGALSLMLLKAIEKWVS